MAVKTDNLTHGMPNDSRLGLMSVGVCLCVHARVCVCVCARGCLRVQNARRAAVQALLHTKKVHTVPVQTLLVSFNPPLRHCCVSPRTTSPPEPACTHGRVPARPRFTPTMEEQAVLDSAKVASTKQSYETDALMCQYLSLVSSRREEARGGVQRAVVV